MHAAEESRESDIAALLHEACVTNEAEGDCETFLVEYEASLPTAILDSRDDKRACIKVGACTSEELEAGGGVMPG
jgi:hypothetical protein